MLDKIVSNFALLDVESGHKELTKHFENRPLAGVCPEELRIPVTITGYISGVWGDHDGKSQQFDITVDSVSIEEAKP